MALTLNGSDPSGDLGDLLDAKLDLAGGKILQVVSAVLEGGSRSTSSSTYSDTLLSASITPSSDSSKILVLVHQAGCGKVSSNTRIRVKLLRDSTDIHTMSFSDADTASTSANAIGTISAAYLDSPSTTSSVTYKTQFASSANTASVFVNNGGGSGSIVLLEVSE